MTDALTSMESWMRGLRMSLTDASLALHGNAVPDAVPPEALAKLRCTLFAADARRAVLTPAPEVGE